MWLLPRNSKRLRSDISGAAVDDACWCRYSEFTVHKLILGAGKYIIENIADCSQLPARGSYAVALPLRIDGGTESPMRIIALVPR